MAKPEGYRKAQRLFKLAERHGLPVLTFVDTPGAYPGVAAEEGGQARAIAETMLRMARLTVPVIATIIGEGGSGGALALAVADRVLMLENATYSVITPEGCAAILWRDADFAPQAAEALRPTASQLLELMAVEKVVDGAARRRPPQPRAGGAAARRRASARRSPSSTRSRRWSGGGSAASGSAASASGATPSSRRAASRSSAGTRPRWSEPAPSCSRSARVPSCSPPPCAAGCGGSPSADVGPYLGVWQRVEAGAPNPDFTLTIARRDDAVGATFANLTNGQSQTVAATVEDGYLACTLPTGDDPGSRRPRPASPPSPICSSASTRTASSSSTSCSPTARSSRSGSTSAPAGCPRRPAEP